MKTILVATDFSEAARNAAKYAAELARVCSAKLLLFHAAHIHSPLAAGVNDGDNGLDVDQSIDEESIVLNETSGVVIDHLINEGDAVNEILSVENQQAPDLLVVGMKNITNFRKLIFGSVATDVINKTRTPVIIVPEKYLFKSIENIAFGIDFDLKREIQMHKSIKDLFEFFKPNTFLINIVKEGSDIRPNDCISEQNVEKYFENKEHLYCFLEDNDLIRGLKDFIAWHKIDLLVMMPHERNLLGKLFAESSTKKMAFNTDIPLLILPAV